MTTTSTFVGIGDNQRISSRVLKPPGGGSSISFGDDGDYDIKRKSTPVQDDPKQKAQQSPKAESNGEGSLQTTEENGSASLKHSPSGGSSTPNYSKLDTQGRLFGGESQDHSGRKVRDHQRSRIFSDADENITTKVDSPLGNENEGAKIQKQRIPPGGASSKLW